MSIDQVDLTTAQKPTAATWEGFFNTIINAVNVLIALGLTVNPAGKLVKDIAGDATTVGGLTPAEIVAGDFPEILKTLADLIAGDDGLVLSGGVATKNGSTATRLDITACVVLQKIAATGYFNRVELAATYKSTALPNTAYYLDVEDGASDFSWGTSHPVGDYVPIASVLTDGSGNISTVTDARPLTAALFGGQTGVVTASPSSHALTSHTAAALTTGHFLKATGATAFAFGAHGLTASDVSAAPTTRSIATTTPLSGGGDLSADRTLTHLDTAGYKHIPTDGAAEQWLKYSAAGTAAWTTLLGETDATAYRGDRGATAYTHSQASHLALGATSATAYRGDRGTTAYDHSQASHAYLPLAGGTVAGNVAMNGVLNANQTNGRVVLPVGTDKFATA